MRDQSPDGRFFRCDRHGPPTSDPGPRRPDYWPRVSADGVVRRPWSDRSGSVGARSTAIQEACSRAGNAARAAHEAQAGDGGSRWARRRAQQTSRQRKRTKPLELRGTAPGRSSGRCAEPVSRSRRPTGKNWQRWSPASRRKRQRGIRRNCRTELARGVVLIAERHGHRHWRGHAVRSSAGGALRRHETQETGGREVVAGGREPLDRRRDQEDSK